MRLRAFSRLLALGVVASVTVVQAVHGAGQVKLLLPLKRTAYQTNETIMLAVVRSSGEALAAGTMTLELRADDGARLLFTFPTRFVPAEGGEARETVHIAVNGRLLRPGTYQVAVAADDARAAETIGVFSHIRRSDFRLVCWGRATGADQLCEGEENLGFNLFYGHYGDDRDANFIRAGVDAMGCCVMSGGHQMDLRMECDWSDPYVTLGGTQRVVQRALIDRTRPNVPGVHFYDEPGLTWHKDPATGEMTPHMVPAQVRSYIAAFGHEPLSYLKVDPTRPGDVAAWRQWARWKLGFMDAAWKEAQFGVSYVRPDFISATQSQYGFSAFTDGYYFNVVRSLPIISGHGGYHDWGPGYWNPSWTLEMARARDLARPCWYLPAWYANTTSDQFRLEQYLSFQTNIQGMICPPDIDPFKPEAKPAAQGVVESNRLMGRLGTIFTTMPVTRPPVALLFSLSDLIHEQTGNMKLNYAHDTAHGRNTTCLYLAGKLLQQQFLPVVDEDIIDGTVAVHHKAIILTSIKYLDPEVVAGLERFIKTGGIVWTTADTTVAVSGAVGIGITPRLPTQDRIDALVREGKGNEAAVLGTMRYQLQAARQVADALKPLLAKAGIAPVFECDQPGIAATRQAAGDVEYLFAVNATHDADGDPQLGLMAATAAIRLAEGGTLYDAVLTGPAQGFVDQGGARTGSFRFGPGQMRVWARTARPIGSARAARPVVYRDYTITDAPLVARLGACVVDQSGRLLSGSIPLEIKVTDPLGAVRHTLYRATDRGTWNGAVQLGVNDPPGQWKVAVKELLGGTEDVAPFVLEAVSECGAAAGTVRRAVVFPDDVVNIFRFFRVHQDVTIVKGTSAFCSTAAERLARILAPWEVRCRTVDATAVNRARALTPEEAATWTGIAFGQAKAGEGNPPEMSGFVVQGPVILLGNPGDNPLIAYLAKNRLLPYETSEKEFPGRGRGMLAWQRDSIGKRQESIAVVAYDEAGMSEAVGSLYEVAAGLEPLTPYAMPADSAVTPAAKLLAAPEPKVLWQSVCPDRVDALSVRDGALDVLTHDGTLSTLDAAGKQTASRVLDAASMTKTAGDMKTQQAADALQAARKAAGPGQLAKAAARGGDLIIAAYWGGRVKIISPEGEVRFDVLLDQDVSAVAWLGDKPVAGLADGRVLAFGPQ